VLSWELLEELFWNIKRVELHLWFMRPQRDISFPSYDNLVHTYVYKLFGLIWTLWSLCRILLCNSGNPWQSIVHLLLSACKKVRPPEQRSNFNFCEDKHTLLEITCMISTLRLISFLRVYTAPCWTCTFWNGCCNCTLFEGKKWIFIKLSMDNN
jgi:hypothetical protein